MANIQVTRVLTFRNYSMTKIRSQIPCRSASHSSSITSCTAVHCHSRHVLKTLGWLSKLKQSVLLHSMQNTSNKLVSFSGHPAKLRGNLPTSVVLNELNVKKIWCERNVKSNKSKIWAVTMMMMPRKRKKMDIGKRLNTLDNNKCKLMILNLQVCPVHLLFQPKTLENE